MHIQYVEDVCVCTGERGCMYLYVVHGVSFHSFSVYITTLNWRLPLCEIYTKCLVLDVSLQNNCRSSPLISVSFFYQQTKDSLDEEVNRRKDKPVTSHSAKIGITERAKASLGVSPDVDSGQSPLPGVSSTENQQKIEHCKKPFCKKASFFSI